jgi:NAD(P)-dependent dehydrogenase (short-subunit alcohol dehydrogenase family)
MHNRPGTSRGTALVTGCSSGFGLLTAVELAHRGFRVYATMRDLGKQAPLRKAAEAADVRLSILPLDVTDNESITRAVEAALSAAGRIDVVVSNAGYGLGGFVEDVTLTELREQFDTNFFGAVALAKAVLPSMRARHAGRLIFVSSVNGFLGFPGLSAYAASKFALEGFAESLRWEVLPDGIYVSLVEPGSFPTAIFGANRRTAAASADPASPYYARGRRLEALVRGRVAAIRRDSRVVARTITRVALTPRPRLRYRVGADAHLALLARRLLPDRVFDAAMRRMQGY